MTCWLAVGSPGEPLGVSEQRNEVRIRKRAAGSPRIRYPGAGARRPWEIFLGGQTLLSKGQGGRHSFGKASGTCCYCQTDRSPALSAQVLVSHAVQRGQFLTAPICPSTHNSQSSLLPWPLAFCELPGLRQCPAELWLALRSGPPLG